MENDNTSNIQRFRLENEQGVLECELEAIFQTSDIRSQDIIARLREIDKEIDLNFKQGELIQEEIYNNTSHADKLDYIIAASCGFLTGLIDVFFVGTFSLDRGKAWSNKTVNNFVMDVAKKCGYSGDRLDGAIKFLEDKYKIASDNAFSGQGIGVSPKSHHLDDFAHHPTIIGLLFS